MLYGILEVRSRRLHFVSAAHPGLIHARPDRPPTSAAVPGFPIGLTEQAVFEERILQLHPGDRLYLFSDGLTEALSPADEQFGLGRLEQSLFAMADEPIERIPPRVLAEVLRWTGDEPQDDLSLLSIAVD
jgi:sigma-B regulation protein RsbU (phosphoserine phosphatase)